MITLDYQKADSADSRSGSRITGIFGSKGQSALAALQKGKEQQRIVCSHLLRIGSESASSNEERKPKDFPTWIPDSYPLEYEIEAAEGQRRSCKQGTFDSPNQGVMADMDTLSFQTVTDLRNHNIGHSTKELCAGMPSLC